MNVNDEVTSLLRYENRLQRDIVKELGFVSSFIVTTLCTFLHYFITPLAALDLRIWGRKA